MAAPPILWSPSEQAIETALATQFARQMVRKHRLELNSYPEFYQWTVDNTETFWSEVWDFCGVVASRKGQTVLVDGGKMPGARWFPDARLNFAENLMRRGDRGDAFVLWDERGFRRRLSYSDLTSEVSRAVQALKALGWRPGARAGAFIPNIPETATLALAALSQGIVWSSCSPDFGVEGVLERFGQIEPKVLFCADGYRYNGEEHGSLERVREIAEQLPTVRKVVVVPHLDPKVDVSDIPKAVTLDEWLRRYTAGEIPFAQLPFDHPVFILFTSGTTGKPKCIVHGAGGSLLQALKMYKLHLDLHPGDRYFYFCTTNWVVWNLLFASIAAESSVMLYDGSPFAKNARILFDYAEKKRITHFGTPAKYLDSIANRGPKPSETHDLAALRMIVSTGSPPSPEGYDFVYASIKKDVCLASVSGGTDVMGAFADASIVLPAYPGQMQCRSFGMDVAVFAEPGNSLVGRKGELVCKKPFPSIPLAFWNDRTDDRYHAAYFDKYPNVWCHGDWSELTERGTLIVYGRSDATLNPGGVRIGTAEIYRVVEGIDEVEESVAIGQLWPPDNPTDTRVVLFVKLRENYSLQAPLEERIRFETRRRASPHHVPAKIVQDADIPRTKNGKVVELAVKAVVHGMPVANTDALANPEALELFKDLPELAS